MGLIILIGEDGSKIGNVTIEEAERLAKEAGKDLSMKAKNVYRIADEGKLKYERNKRQKQRRLHHRTHKVKEVKIGPLIEEHDLNTKAKHICEFLKRGFKTKITMFFKGRQAAFKSVGIEKIHRLIQPLVKEKIAVIDRDLKIEGKKLTVFLTPYKK